MKSEKGRKVATCNDSHCPNHGNLNIRGRVLSGKITSSKMRRTCTFELERMQKIPKYQRYETRITKLKVHNPDCISAVPGNQVKIMECKPLSKTKKFVIIEKKEK